MAQRIIYRNENGGVALLCPAPEYDINLVALKDVPHGQPFKIIDESDLPADFDFFDAWEVQEAALTDGHGAAYGVGSDMAVVSWGEDGNHELAQIVREGGKEYLLYLPKDTPAT